MVLTFSSVAGYGLHLFPKLTNTIVYIYMYKSSTIIIINMYFLVFADDF